MYVKGWRHEEVFTLGFRFLLKVVQREFTSIDVKKWRYHEYHKSDGERPAG